MCRHGYSVLIHALSCHRHGFGILKHVYACFYLLFDDFKLDLSYVFYDTGFKNKNSENTCCTCVIHVLFIGIYL